MVEKEKERFPFKVIVCVPSVVPREPVNLLERSEPWAVVRPGWSSCRVELREAVTLCSAHIPTLGCWACIPTLGLLFSLLELRALSCALCVRGRELGPHPVPSPADVIHDHHEAQRFRLPVGLLSKEMQHLSQEGLWRVLMRWLSG